jgi:putative membrane-bound dehydrogenase-like protein
MTRLVCFFVLLLAVAVSGQQGPNDTLAGLKPAPGLAVSLFAAEPDVQNPTDLTVDERGRVWVLEGVNYRRQSRMQPDLRPEGDRIVILEDTDNDGKSDRTKVFDQGPHIRVPLGIAVLGDKVYVSQSPDITVYTKDQNDNILRKEVLLTGFGGVDHDHGLHAVVFGLDGKLYFNHGNTGFDITDKSGRRFVSQGTAAEGNREGYFQGVALRMNLDGTNLEVLSQNFRNPYELAVDSFGNVYQTDNDDDGNEMVRLKYLVEGGNYGFRGPLNRTWLEDRGTHWHQEVPGVFPNLLRLGAGSPCGLLVYEGTLLPAKYRGQVFHAEAGKRILAMYSISDEGAGYRAVSEDVLNTGADTWSRPSDAAVAPDGAVFVADWYDPGVGGHNMGDLEGNRGRIYRLAPTGNRPAVPALDLTSDAGLTAALSSANPTRQYVAYQAIKAKGQAAAPLLQAMWRQRADAVARARALWLLGGLGADGSAAIQEALKDQEPRYRILGLRVARAQGMNMLATSRPLVRDASPQVRREIALMLQDSTTMLPAYLYPRQVEPPAEWLEAMTGLISQYDGRDRWYLEALAIAARGREDAIYARMKSQGTPITPAQAGILWALRPRTALPDLVARANNSSLAETDRAMALDTLGQMQWPEAARALEAFITAPNVPTPLVERAFNNYSHQLFSLWIDARTSQALPAVMQKGFSLPGTQSAAVTIADALGDRQYLAQLIAFAKQESANTEARSLAIESVAAARDAQYLSDFKALAAAGVPAVRVSAIRAVGLLGRPGPPPAQGQPAAPAAVDPSSVIVSWAQGIALSNAPNEVRVEALRLMGQSVPGLNAMLDLAAKGQVPPELVSVARNLANNAAPPPAPGRRGQAQSPVTMRADPTMPTDPAYVAIRSRAANILPMPSARRIPTAFALDLNYAGKAVDGKKVFDIDAGCAACHSLGGARRMGPDLSKIGAKYGKQAMLDNIVNPNDAIQFEYVNTTFTMTNGEEIMGLVAGESGGQITLRIGVDQERRIQTADVKARRESRVSSMPEGLLNALSLQQIADLLEYLATLK